MQLLSKYFGKRIQQTLSVGGHKFSESTCWVCSWQGFFQQFWEKAPNQNWEKIIELTSKLGEINDIEHNKGSKIYPQNQVILDCIMPSIPLKHKCLSIIMIYGSLFLIRSSGI